MFFCLFIIVVLDAVVWCGGDEAHLLDEVVDGGLVALQFHVGVAYLLARIEDGECCTDGFGEHDLEVDDALFGVAALVVADDGADVGDVVGCRDFVVGEVLADEFDDFGADGGGDAFGVENPDFAHEEVALYVAGELLLGQQADAADEAVVFDVVVVELGVDGESDVGRDDGLLAFGGDFVDVEVLGNEFVGIKGFLARGAEGLALGLDEGVAAGGAGVDDGGSVVVESDVLEHFVALGTAQLSAEVVGVFGRDVGAAEVVDDFFGLDGGLSALGAGAYVEQVGVEAGGAEIDFVDELGGSEEAFLGHGLHEDEVVAEFVLSEAVEEVEDGDDVACGG